MRSELLFFNAPTTGSPNMNDAAIAPAKMDNMVENQHAKGCFLEN